MIVIHVVEPFAAGVAVFVKSLTEAMPQDKHIIIHGERKSVMDAAEVRKSFESDNVRFIRWRSAQRSINPLRDTVALFELFTLLRRLKASNMADVVHLHSSKSGLLGRIACRMAGISNVFYTPNGAAFFSAPNRISRFFYRQFERMGQWFGGKVICCSSSEKAGYDQLGVDAAFINNSVEVEPAYETAPLKKDPVFRIVTSGRIDSQKNPALFNEIATYFEGMPDIEFVWIGDGADRAMLDSKNIRVTGWQQGAAVREIMASSDLYISTSRYEGLSFAVLEALALRKPVLLSHCPGNVDIVKQGANGNFFRSASGAIATILQYHNNPEMLEVMGQFSYDICRAEFNSKKNFKIYREFYSGALESRPAASVQWKLA